MVGIGEKWRRRREIPNRRYLVNVGNYIRERDGWGRKCTTKLQGGEYRHTSNPSKIGTKMKGKLTISLTTTSTITLQNSGDEERNNQKVPDLLCSCKYGE